MFNRREQFFSDGRISLFPESGSGYIFLKKYGIF